jgi:AcrR family transcriptional regulator
MSERVLRADAARNRERVMRAAMEVVGERGSDACIPEIAARAGVGKATVYRTFPTKEHLIAAVLVQRLRWFEERARDAAREDDAWVAFRGLLVDAAEAEAHHALAAGFAAGNPLPELAAARDASCVALGDLMRRAQVQGAMRPDATAAEVRTLFAGAMRVLATEDVQDTATWRRFAELVADAVRG